MAYAVTGNTAADALSEVFNGRRCWRWRVTETEASSGSEFTLYGVPSVGTITLINSKLTPGSGTTVQPEVGRGASWVDDSIDDIGRIDAAGRAREEQNRRYTLNAGQAFVVRTQVNSGSADNTVVTEITIYAGHF